MVKVNRKKISGTIVIIICAASFMMYAYSTGITGRTLKNGDGCTCHGISSPGVSVVISGPDTLAPNESATYSVTITGGPLVRAGTNISASDGVLAPVASDLRSSAGELTHVAPKLPVGEAVTFQFTYTAPAAAGTQTLYANGNSVNFNGTNTGDNWNFASNKVITINAITAVDDQIADRDYRLEQNYPNPFNPSTRINFTLAEPGNAEISVYNSLGEKVSELLSGFMDSGSHSVDFNASGLASGIYYYKLITNGFVSTKKMMLVR